MCTPRNPVAQPARNALAALTILLALGGCASSGQNAGFQAAAEAQREAQAQTEAPASATLDTQATYLRLVEQMQQGELWFASLAHIDALETRWGVTPESNRLRADALRHTGQFADSERLYQRLAGTPLAAAGYHGLGLLAGGRGDFNAAIGLFEQARRLQPANDVLLGDLGYALLRAGDLVQARIRLSQALQLKPDNLQAQLNMALYFEANGEPLRANALMAEQKLPAAMQASVRQAALQIRGDTVPHGPIASQPDAAQAGKAALPAAALPIILLLDSGTRPLALKPSGWSGLPPSLAGGLSAQELKSTTAAAAAAASAPDKPTGAMP